MQQKLLCIGKQNCISCCTRGIEKLSKKELDGILSEHARIFKKHKDLKDYVKNIRKNRLVCEYLSKTGCLIHPSVINKETRHKAPKNNLLRGKCTDKKTCKKELLMEELSPKVRKKLQKELDKSKDYYDYSIKVKHLIPRVYVQQKLGKLKLNGFAKWYLDRIVREPEQRNCFRLKARLDFLVKIARIFS